MNTGTHGLHQRRHQTGTSGGELQEVQADGQQAIQQPGGGTGAGVSGCSFQSGVQCGEERELQGEGGEEDSEIDALLICCSI